MAAKLIKYRYSYRFEHWKVVTGTIAATDKTKAKTALRGRAARGKITSIQLEPILD